MGWDWSRRHRVGIQAGQIAGAVGARPLREGQRILANRLELGPILQRFTDELRHARGLVVQLIGKRRSHVFADG